LTFGPVTTGPSVLELLIGNGFSTFGPGDHALKSSEPKINKVPLIPRMDVWTEFEEDSSRRSQVIDRK